jgi:hypothetical protein
MQLTYKGKFYLASGYGGSVRDYLVKVLDDNGGYVSEQTTYVISPEAER